MFVCFLFVGFFLAKHFESTFNGGKKRYINKLIIIIIC